MNKVDYLCAKCQDMETPKENPKAFENLGLRQSICQTLTKQDLVEATPIQRRVIPLALTGKNIVGVARTGTGKTLAFLLPLIDAWIEDKTKQFVILCPSKELAHQIQDQFILWNETFSISYALVTGGMKEKSIKNIERKMPDVIIANPGMLSFLMKKNRLKLEQISTLVLDEVDQMMEKSMEADMDYILEKCPSHAQKMFFSATIPKPMLSKIEDLAKDIEWIEIQKHISNKLNIVEKMYYSDDNDKEELLFHVLYENLREKTLIFFNDRFRAREVYQALVKADFKVGFIHGKKGSNTRINTINKFKSNEYNILIATDVLGRGIDITDIKMVINFEIPDNKENYEHRIGRTGRQGRKGTALSFCSYREIARYKNIEKLHKETIKEVFNHPFYKAMPSAQPKTKLKNKGLDGSNTHRLAWNDLLKGKK